MSVHVSSWAWRQTVGDAGTKLVLLKLADNADDAGLCWRRQSALAEECEMSRPTVQRKLYRLRDLGLLEIRQRRPNPKKPNQIGANFYQLRVPPPQREALEADEGERKPQGEAPPASQLRGDPPHQSRDAAESSMEEPSFESPIEQPELDAGNPFAQQLIAVGIAKARTAT